MIAFLEPFAWQHKQKHKPWQQKDNIYLALLDSLAEITFIAR